MCIRDSASANGAAYVFTRTGNTWTEQQRLEASDIATVTRFGSRVAINGNTALVTDDLFTGNTAYVFTRTSGTWTQQRRLEPSDATAGDSFGSSVALSADTIVAGAPGEDDPEQGGAVYTFADPNIADWTYSTNPDSNAATPDGNVNTTNAIFTLTLNDVVNTGTNTDVTASSLSSPNDSLLLEWRDNDTNTLQETQTIMLPYNEPVDSTFVADHILNPLGENFFMETAVDGDTLRLTSSRPDHFTLTATYTSQRMSTDPLRITLTRVANTQDGTTASPAIFSFSGVSVSIPVGATATAARNRVIDQFFDTAYTVGPAGTHRVRFDAVNPGSTGDTAPTLMDATQTITTTFTDGS